jgi:esterase/lipase superfamily enzyme
MSVAPYASRVRHTIRNAALACASLGLAACQAPVRLMPTPVPFVQGDVDPFARTGDALAGADLPVFYATNRLAVVEQPEPTHVPLPVSTLRMGVAHVRVGDDTLDWETLHRLSTSADPGERPVLSLRRLTQVTALEAGREVEDSPTARAFFERVDAALAASPHPDLLVYVHGARNSVPRAAEQASQFRHFSGRRMVVLVFIWPSAGSLLRYLTDVANAAASVDDFARLIERLARHTRARSIDVLAYSAGAQVVGPALARLAAPRDGESRARQRARLRLGQVYYAAPDVDTRRFVDQAKTYVDLAERVSVAANLNDSALRASAILAGASRAGRPDPGELSAEQTRFLAEASNALDFDLLYVDPTTIPDLPLRSHAFWYESPWVSGDLLAKFLLRTPPGERGLEPRFTDAATRFWWFPPDFDRRLSAIVRDAFGPDGALRGVGARPAAD